MSWRGSLLGSSGSGSVIGIDLGSTTTKAVLFDEGGAIIGQGITNSRSDYGVACAVAGLVVGTLGMTDLTGKIASAMFTLAKGSQMLTLMIATLVVIVLGMGMPTPAVYALSAVLAGPALLALGVRDVGLSAHGTLHLVLGTAAAASAAALLREIR